jgi:hypothetical protein
MAYSTHRPRNPVDKLAREINRLGKQVSRQPQLPYASIDGGVTTIREILTNPADALRFVNNDVAVWNGVGNLPIPLTHVPWSDSLQVKLNGHVLESTDWTYNSLTNVVTIPHETWWQANDEVGSAYYAYDRFAPAFTPPVSSTSYDALVLAQPTLLGYWRLAETSGLVMEDSSGNGRHGTYSADVILGAASLLTGDPDTSAHFPAGGSETRPRGVVPFGSWMNVPTFSIETWAATDTMSSGILALPNRDTNQRSWVWYSTSGGGMNFTKIQSGEVASVIDGSADLDDTNRHFLAITYDGGNLRQYIDGELAITTPMSGDMSTSADFAIGGTYSGFSTWWDTFFYKGRQGKVAMYAGVQSGADIAERWQKGSTGV